jgi:hypothetical protein
MEDVLSCSTSPKSCLGRKKTQENLRESKALNAQKQDVISIRSTGQSLESSIPLSSRRKTLARWLAIEDFY